MYALINRESNVLMCYGATKQELQEKGDNLGIKYKIAEVPDLEGREFDFGVNPMNCKVDDKTEDAAGSRTVREVVEAMVKLELFSTEMIFFIDEKKYNIDITLYKN